MSEKTASQKLKEKLFINKENGLKNIDDKKLEEINRFCEGYKQFLAEGKTEREAALTAKTIAKKAGFEPFDRNKKYKAGDKYFVDNRGKTVAFVVVGKKSAEEGLKITAAHIDSPRIDLKPNPLYEDSELALFKTHYYGGIKKYQWTAMPLAFISSAMALPT